MSDKKKKLVIILPLLVVFFMGPLLKAWGKYYQPREIVSMPTAGILSHGQYAVGLELFPSDGLQAEAMIGLLGRFQIGFSYGGENILGEGDVNLNPHLEINTRLRFIEESLTFPAMAIGFNSQGKAGFWDEYKRYLFKSPGIYLVSSKNFKTIGGNIGIHGGLNYSFETKDGNKNPSGFLGFDKEFGQAISVNLEYNLAINDNKKGDQVFGEGKGYLNFSFCWAVSRSFELEVLFQDLLVNNATSTTFRRGLRLNIYNSF
ncbi:hypothetical protein JW877_08320 [bacterium]|nr:hypothetical protein [bacterium]